MIERIGVDGCTFNTGEVAPFPKHGATSPYVKFEDESAPFPHFPTMGSNKASTTGRLGPSPFPAVHAGDCERNMLHTYLDRRRLTRSTSASVDISEGWCTLMSPMNTLEPSAVITSILRSVHVGCEVTMSRRNLAPIRRSFTSSISSSLAVPRSTSLFLAPIAPPGISTGAFGAVSRLTGASGSSHRPAPGVSAFPPAPSPSPTLAFFLSGPPPPSISPQWGNDSGADEGPKKPIAFADSERRDCLAVIANPKLCKTPMFCTSKQ